MTKVAIKKCSDYNLENVQYAVNEAVALLGGIEKFVKPGQKVLIKPNILSGRRPEDGVCTHPEIVRAVIKLIKPITANIYVGDSPGGFDVINLDDIYEMSGMVKLCRDEAVQLVKFDQAEIIDGIPFAKIISQVDVIINLPKMKTHGLAVLTGAVKNMFGAAIGKYKAESHFKHTRIEDFAHLLVKIFMHVKPALNIMDGIVAMEGDGPAAGKLRNASLVLASADAVALDAVFAELVGVAPESVLTTVYAADMNLGVSKVSDIEILGEPLDKSKIDNFILPQASFIYNAPEWTIKIFGKLIKSYPFINRRVCTYCHICEKNCPVTAINILKSRIDYSKCIFCFCCHELCPYKAIGVRKKIMGKLLGFVMKVRHSCRQKQ